MYNVIIDLGHVDYSSGAVEGDFREDELNKSIGNYVVEELRRHEVSVTVTTGTLEYRVRIENLVRPDLFVSIHNNSGGGDGTEVLYFPSSVQGKILSQTLIDTIVSDGLNNSRGIVPRSNLYVLKYTKSPSALVECAFMDTSDVQAIDTEEERKAFGVSIAKGILKYLGVTYIEQVIATPDLPSDFDSLTYMTVNPDVCKFYAEKHYTEIGYNECFEGRRSYK